MWNGAANGDWANNSNWVWDNHTPGASDTARIDSAGPLIAAGTTGAVDTLFVSISNAADLSVAGTLNSGTVTLGYNSAASGTLSVSGGSWTNSGNLYIGNAGTGAVNLTNGAIASSYSAYLGAVSGGSGSVIVDDANWTIGNGRIIVGDYGSGSLTLRNGATVSGPGGIIGGNVGGSGTVTVSDSNWTNTGNLYVGNAGNGTLAVNAGGSVTSVDGYVGTLTGSHSSVTVSGPGANWSLSGAFVAGYQSGTTADIVISNGGVISAVQGTLGDLAGASGTMLVTGSGSVWSAFVNPAIAYTGYMNVGLDGDGKLTVQNGGGVSGYQFYIGNNSTSTGTVTLSGAGSYISMTNNLFVGADGNGTLTISDGALVSAKAIKIAYSVGSSGTLNIGAAAGQAPAAAGTISANQIIFGAGSGALVLNHTDDNYLVAANISGSGQVLVENGVTTLSGSNTYTGGTTVSGGRLIVDGSIANGLLTVNSGAVLSGTGTVGDTVMNGGTLALGNPGQTLTVSGNLSFTAASAYMIEVTPSASDRVNVTGTATLGGAAVNATFAAGSYVAKRYTILNATGGRVGSFSSLVSTNLPTNFASSLSYDANNAYLDLSLSYKPVNTNQSNVANALSGVFNAGGKMQVAFGALTPAGLSQAAGETSTGSQQTTFDAVNLFMGAMLDPFVAGRNDQVSPSAGGMSSYAEERGPRDAYAMFTKAMPVKADPLTSSWNVWATGFGGSQTTDGNSATGSNTSTSRIYGVAVGADYRIAPNTIAGFAMSGGGTTFSVANGGSGSSDLFQVGAFARHNIGSAYLNAALSYAWQDVTTNRNVAGTDQLRARFNVNAFSGRLEGGNRYVTPWMGVGATPYAAVQLTAYDLPSYREQVQSGPGIFALNYAATDVTSTRSELGLRTDKSYALTDSILTLRSRFAWAHEFNPDRSVAATFQSVPGASFVVTGARQASDAALTTASAELKWRSGFSVAAIFEGEFSDVTTSYAGKGVARYQW